MPHYRTTGNLTSVSYVTGPRHVWLGLELSTTPHPGPTVVRRPPNGTCDHGEILEAEVIAAVRRGLRGTGLSPVRVVFVDNDTPDYGLYAHCAKLLARRFLEP